MQDRQIILHGAKLYHGKHNDRIYVTDMYSAEPDILIPELDRLAVEHNYSKISVRVPDHARQPFLDEGYIEEASIPAFYHGKEAVRYMARFRSAARAEDADPARIRDVLETSRSKRRQPAPSLPEHCRWAIAEEPDLRALATLYAEVFPSYPFPIQDARYLHTMMNTTTVYFLVRDNDNTLIAASSAEMDRTYGHAEMTDFATLPQHRGSGLAQFLLDIMEKEMLKREIATAFTIARAVSYGMNSTFARRGYHFGGTLVNNTNISGSTESMNIWYKALQGTR